MSDTSARITLTRLPKPVNDQFFGYRVIVDDAEVGSIRRRQTKTFNVPPGTHEIYLTMQKKFRCPSVRLDLSPGEEARLVCMARPKSAWPNKMPNMYMVLEVEGAQPGSAT